MKMLKLKKGNKIIEWLIKKYKVQNTSEIKVLRWTKQSFNEALLASTVFIDQSDEIRFCIVYKSVGSESNVSHLISGI